MIICLPSIEKANEEFFKQIAGRNLSGSIVVPDRNGAVAAPVRYFKFPHNYTQAEREQYPIVSIYTHTPEFSTLYDNDVHNYSYYDDKIFRIHDEFGEDSVVLTRYFQPFFLELRFDVSVAAKSSQHIDFLRNYFLVKFGKWGSFDMESTVFNFDDDVLRFAQQQEVFQVKSGIISSEDILNSSLSDPRFEKISKQPLNTVFRSYRYKVSPTNSIREDGIHETTYEFTVYAWIDSGAREILDLIKEINVSLAQIEDAENPFRTIQIK